MMVCPFDCQTENGKTIRPIFIKPGRRVQHVPRKNP